MGDVLSPFTISPSPTPFSSTNKNSMPMLYYGLVVVGTAVMVLAIYNLIIINRCNHRRHTHSPHQTTPNINRLVQVVVTSTSSSEGRSFPNNNSHQRNYFLSSFKYKKEAATAKEGDQEQQHKQQRGCDDSDECAVCLSVYEEGEEVRKLPRCKHSFHALCIDMWLYSHFDCPICRTPVGPFCHPFPAENSR